MLALIDQVRSHHSAVNEYKVDLGTPRMGGDRQVDLHVAPLTERHRPYRRDAAGAQPRRQDGPATDAPQCRALVNALAAVLAHEIKNPLAGIRGAAQLLERGLAPKSAR